MPADELLDRLHKRRPPATSDKEENDDPNKKIPTETTTEHGTDEKQDDENALTVNDETNLVNTKEQLSSYIVYEGDGFVSPNFLFQSEFSVNNVGHEREIIF